MDYQPDFRRPDDGEAFGIRGFIGLGLLVMGVLIALWVFVTVLDFLEDPAELMKYRAIIDKDLETGWDMDEGGSGMVIPSTVLSYFILFLVMGICVKVAGLFIRGGTDLLTGSGYNLARRFERKVEEIRSLMRDKPNG
ncbi:hypothetical protein JW906_12665 [bacterium]|nr:hypothetical protein [bacterium]